MTYNYRILLERILESQDPIWSDENLDIFSPVQVIVCMKLGRQIEVSKVGWE